MENNKTASDAPTQATSDYLEISFRFLCFLIGAPVNGYVFFRLCRRAAVSSSRSLLLKLQLNISDLMVLFFYSFVENISGIMGTFHGGEVMCRVLKVANELSFQISSAIMVCIGIDRMLSVVVPFTPLYYAKKRVRIMICLAWFYSTVSSIDNLWMWKIYHGPDRSAPKCVGHMYFMKLTNQTVGQFWHDYELARTIYSIISVFWLPFIVMCVTYTVIVTHVWRHYTNPIIRELTSHCSVTDKEAATFSSKVTDGNKASRSRRFSWMHKLKKNQQMTQREPHSHGTKANNSSSKSDPKTAKDDQLEVLLETKRRRSFELHDLPAFPVQNRPGGNVKFPSSNLPNVYSNQNAADAACAHCSRPPQIESVQARQSHRNAARLLSNPTPEHVIRVRRVPIKMLKTTVCLMNVYFLCWMPYQCSVLWYYIDRASYMQHQTLIKVLQLLMVLNSVINPWIYGLYATEIQPHLRSFDVGACWDTLRFIFWCGPCGTETPSGSDQQNAAERFG